MGNIGDRVSALVWVKDLWGIDGDRCRVTYMYMYMECGVAMAVDGSELLL
jgi:hypothetical protein